MNETTAVVEVEDTRITDFSGQQRVNKLGFVFQNTGPPLLNKLLYVIMREQLPTSSTYIL